MNDQELQKAILEGQPDAFRRLIGQYKTLVNHMIGRLFDNPEDVNELCQETFIKVHASLVQFRGDSQLGTWIARIAFTTAAAALRRRQIPMVELDDENDEQAEYHDSGENPADLVSEENMAAALLAAIAALPPLQKSLVGMYYLEEMPLAEMCMVTGMPVGTVKNHLFRARARLRQILERQSGVQR
jgi:RNA polymerase sigma factor (sigma-70 family)